MVPLPQSKTCRNDRLCRPNSYTYTYYIAYPGKRNESNKTEDVGFQRGKL